METDKLANIQNWRNKGIQNLTSNFTTTFLADTIYSRELRKKQKFFFLFDICINFDLA